MSFVCLWIPDWPTAAGSRTSSTGGTDLPTALLAVAPHVVTEARGVIWVDARGLDATAIGRRTLEVARRYGGDAPRVGVAQTAIAAEVAAIHGDAPLVTVPNGIDVTFLAPFPLAVLAPSPQLRTALTDMGLYSCGDLARLTQTSVEVRFGAEGTDLWRLARADDRRRGVTGLAVRVDASNAAGASQGDVFDRDFQTARAIEDTIAQLSNDGCTLVEPTVSLHPLPERRTEWQVREPAAAPTAGTWPGAPQLLLQLNPEPRRIAVATNQRRERQVPARFRLPGAAETELLTVLGPDHVSADVETGARYAREYYTCLTDNGLLVLLCRDLLADAWYLHGWWD